MDLFYNYIFIATIWFFQEYKDSKNLSYSFVIGLFWLYEVFYIVSKKTAK